MGHNKAGGLRWASGKRIQIQRWAARRSVALVVSLMRGESAAAEAARVHGSTVGERGDWREKFPPGAENALRSKPRSEEALKDERSKRLKRKVGELVPALDIFREVNKLRPFEPLSAMWGFQE